MYVLIVKDNDEDSCEVRDLLFLREESLPSENVLGKSLLLNVRSE